MNFWLSSAVRLTESVQDGTYRSERSGKSMYAQLRLSSLPPSPRVCLERPSLALSRRIVERIVFVCLSPASGRWYDVFGVVPLGSV